jgi:hypothetical protein
MKLNKSVIIPILFFVFTALGLEALVLPYVPFGSGRWSDSVGTNVSNRSSRINGNLNVTGNYYKNGVLFTGGGSGTPIIASNDGTELTAEMTSINITGNYLTATASGGDVTIKSDTGKMLTVYNLDTTKIGKYGKDNVFTGSNSFGGTTAFDNIYMTGSFISESGITVDALTVVNGATIGTTLVVTDDLTAQSDLIVDGFSRSGGSGKRIKEMYLKGLLSDTTNKTLRLTHGFNKTTMRNIKGFDVSIYHDTTALVWRGMYSHNSHYVPHCMYVYIDSANVNCTMGAACALTSDSIYVTLKYTDDF